MGNKSIEARGCDLAHNQGIPRRGISYSELLHAIQNNRASRGLPPQNVQEHLDEILRTGHYKVWTRVVNTIVGIGC